MCAKCEVHKGAGFPENDSKVKGIVRAQIQGLGSVFIPPPLANTHSAMSLRKFANDAKGRWQRVAYSVPCCHMERRAYPLWSNLWPRLSCPSSTALAPSFIGFQASACKRGIGRFASVSRESRIFSLGCSCNAAPSPMTMSKVPKIKGSSMA